MRHHDHGGAPAMPAELGLQLGEALLVLLADRAVWWPAQRTLFVADVHLGKDAVFRAHGLPIPVGSTVDDLGRLAALCQRHEAKHLTVLGDLVHGRPGPDLIAEVGAWREALSDVAVQLVRGNHDRHLQTLPSQWRMDETGEGRHEALRLVHAPSGEPPRVAELAGHLHPVCRLRDGRADALRVPVFWLRGTRLVLPAFGSFTGGYSVQPRTGDRVFAVGPGQVVELPVGEM